MKTPIILFFNWLIEMRLVILFHRALCLEHGLDGLVEGEVEQDSTLLAGMEKLLRDTGWFSIIFDEHRNIRPGYLLVSEGVELQSTGGLEKTVASDLLVKIIPIYHGG